MRYFRYATGVYLEQQLRCNMTPKQVNRRCLAIRKRLMKRGLSYDEIRRHDLENPFMSEDARKVLINLAQHWPIGKRSIENK